MKLKKREEIKMTYSLLLATNVFNNIQNGVGGIGKNIQTISWTIFTVAVIVSGVAWVIGGRGAEFAKSTLGRVVVAVGVVALATAIISTLAETFGKKGVSIKGGMTMVEPLKMWLALHGVNLY